MVYELICHAQERTVGLSLRNEISWSWQHFLAVLKNRYSTRACGLSIISCPTLVPGKRQRGARSAELGIIILYPTSASVIIVLFKYNKQTLLDLANLISFGKEDQRTI